MKKIIYLILPCYNEQAVLESSANKLLDLIDGLIRESIIDERSKIYFINDGSDDDTWNIIEKIHRKNSIFCGIRLAHNVGHQNTILAGLIELNKKAVSIRLK